MWYFQYHIFILYPIYTFLNSFKGGKTMDVDSCSGAAEIPIREIVRGSHVESPRFSPCF